MKFRNVILWVVIAAGCFSGRNGFASPGDTVDVCRYDIHLGIVHLSDRSISGHTDLRLTTPAANVQSLGLDLLAMEIDSVMVGGVRTLNFQYNDTLLRIGLLSPFSAGDTLNVSIHYHGQPQEDPSGWGGFYFTPDSTYAFNLGVGFESVPHNYGRVWFPCVDNFTDRAEYNCYIRVKSGNQAICGGSLISVTPNGDGTDTYCWKLRDNIPTYLASVAVGRYEAVTDTFNGLLGKIPTFLYTRPQDTSYARNSFVNLNAILSVFETRFGPYRWERVGYVGVPFNNGAMEHATNIAYPNACFTGNLSYESLYAHELSHHWFGDLLTCSTAGDMWINEGWARYCESVYIESLYGKNAYKTNVRDLHKEVVQFAHVTDNGYRALSGMDMAYTYSTTTYDKGADVVHTLRNYMGDSLFFSSIKSLLSDYSFRDISAAGMCDYLEAASGIDLHDFFDAWIFSPGFPHFSIDSFKVTQTSPEVKVAVWVRQRLNHAPAMANSNHLEIAFAAPGWQLYTDTLIFSGATAMREFVVPFVPVAVMADFNEKVSDAITDLNLVIRNVTNYEAVPALCRLEVSALPDSALVRIEHNWVPPDPMKVQNPDIHRLSDYRYWKVDGIFPQGFITKCRFKYNRTTSTTSGYLDNKLLPQAASSDSLLLLYRTGPAGDWEITPFTRVGPSTSGVLMVDTLRRGEYTLAVGKPWHADVKEEGTVENLLRVYPNPSETFFVIAYNYTASTTVKIFDASGRPVEQFGSGPGSIRMSWNPGTNPAGTYLVRLFDSRDRLLGEQKIIYLK